MAARYLFVISVFRNNVEPSVCSLGKFLIFTSDAINSKQYIFAIANGVFSRKVNVIHDVRFYHSQMFMHLNAN